MKIEDTIFSKLKMDEMFDDWFYNTQTEDNFDERIGFYDSVKKDFLIKVKEDFSYDFDIKIDKIDTNNKKFKEYYGKKEFEKIKELAEDWYEDRLTDFYYDFEKIADLTSEGIICRRHIMVEDEEEFIFHLMYGEPIGKFKGIGVCWSWDKDRAEAHNGSSGMLMEVDALIPYSAIDQKLTFDLNMNPSLGEDEAEIRVINGAEVKVISVNGEDFPELISVKA